MKIEITWKFILDLDSIISQFTKRSTSCITNCMHNCIYIRKLTDDNSSFWCDKNSGTNEES